MSSIRYPAPLQHGDLIGVSAPSSGVEPPNHPLLAKAKTALERLGYVVEEGDTIWQNDKCVSASSLVRAQEWERFLLDERIKAVIPPWGGEFLMELLPLLDWERLARAKPKWVLGFSDISTFTFAYTLMTGHASAHGPSYVDLGGDPLDPLTARALEVLTTAHGGRVKQVSSDAFRTSWQVPQPDTQTQWQALNAKDGEAVRFGGRLIGGCMDTISILAGTPYAPVERFGNTYGPDHGLVWYLESCEMNAADIYRHLWQMRELGWFRHTNGILVGRPAGYSPVHNMTLTDALEQALLPLGIPVLYNVDIGHVPPQLTLVNGAVAEVQYSGGSGEITMTFE